MPTYVKVTFETRGNLNSFMSSYSDVSSFFGASDGALYADVSNMSKSDIDKFVRAIEAEKLKVVDLASEPAH